MHRSICLPALCLAALLLASSPAPALVEDAGQSPAPANPRNLYRIMVRFKDGTSERQIRSAHGRVRGRVTWRSRTRRLEAVAVDGDVDLRRALGRYQLHPDVEYAELAAPRRIAAKPNDLLRQQWMFHNQGKPMGWCCPRLRCQPCNLKKAEYVDQGTAGADINAVPAWDLATGSREIVVAVLDTGIDLQRADLAEHVIDGWDFVHDDDNPDDDNGHGTGVSALIGAVGNNGKGLTGLNWDVTLMPVKVCDRFGFCPSDNIVAGIHYAINNGADVINMSLACDEHRDPNTQSCSASFPGTCFSRFEEDAISRAHRHGVVVVEAAGNCGKNNDDATTAYPCAYDLPNNVCAGATNMHDEVAGFSSYGTETVEIGAPGERVTTYLTGREDNYWQPSGTSFASPITAGVAALLMTRTRLDPGIVRERIVANGNLLGESAQFFMGGRLDAYGTLRDVLLPPLLMGTDDPGDVTLLADVTGDGRADLVRGIAGVGFQVSKNSKEKEVLERSKLWSDLVRKINGADVEIFKSANEKQVFLQPMAWSDTPPAPLVLAGDVDGNGRQDLILAETGAGIQVLRSRKRKARPLEAWSAEDPGELLLAGDVDGDGRDDLVSYSGSFRVLRSAGRRFEDPVEWSAEAIRDVAALGDVSGDGRADLVHWTDLGGEVMLEVSLSTGTAFAPPELWRVTFPMEFIDLADMDGDGHQDLVALDPANGCIRILRGRTHRFGGERGWICPDTPDLIFAGQASRKRKDGRADLVTWTNGVGWELLQSSP